MRGGRGAAVRWPWSRALARTAGSAMLPLLVLLVSLTSPARAQSDPRLLAIVRSAQEGQGDSARAAVQQLLDATPPTDSLYPEILYTKAMVAGTAADMRRDLQRVVVEYSVSDWADDALLRLVQMDYATRNLDGATRNLERLRLDYPATPLLAQASYWAGRTYFDLNRRADACRWLADGMTAARGNVELQNQLGYLYQRCDIRSDTTGQATRATAAADSGRAAPSDSGRRAALSDTGALAGATSSPDSSRRAAARADSGQRTPEPPAGVAEPGTRYRVQVAAVGTATTAEDAARKLRAIGLSEVIVKERGLYKVRAGSYRTRSEAQAAANKIKAKLGGKPFVVAEP